MRPQFLSVTLLIFVLSSSLAWADGLIYQLPADGTSAHYELSATSTRGETVHEMTGTLQLSSVGSSIENGVKCRWIEIKMTLKRGDGVSTIVAKVLTPEKELQYGGAPYDKMLRSWVRMREGGDVVKIDDSNKGPLPGFLSGPLKEAKPLEPIVVESKFGNLNCKGVTGFTEFKEGLRDNKVVFETRLHNTAPFGVVKSKMNVTVTSTDNQTRTLALVMTLSKSSKGARTQLAENN
ncbi:MAG: hypothetical protein ACI9G1_002065 [Pirellulaceae bacterium]|jgi:hypothetical protein